MHLVDSTHYHAQGPTFKSPAPSPAGVVKPSYYGACVSFSSFPCLLTFSVSIQNKGTQCDNVCTPTVRTPFTTPTQDNCPY